jgi:hypothetical protein
MKKLQVSLKEAVDLAAEGFEVTCFVEVAPIKKTTGKRARGKPRNPAVPWDAMVIPTTKPAMIPGGKLGVIWQKVHDKLWKGKRLRPLTRQQVEDAAQQAGGYRNFTAEMIHRYKCLRVVEDA